MVISPPGAMGTPPTSLAACTTPLAVTVGVEDTGGGAVTTAVNVGDWPPATVWSGSSTNAFTNMVTVPGVEGRKVPCQMPAPMCVISTESPLETLAFTWVLCAGPRRLPHESDTCTSRVAGCPTIALNVD